MPTEETPAIEQGTGTPMDQIPTDFREYNQWRDTGALPNSEESKPSATAQERAPAGEPDGPVKTDPEPEPEDPQEPDEVDTAPQRPSSRQRRIDRLTRENAELQKRLQALEQTAKPPAVEVLPPKPAGKPDLKDYTTLESYTEALTEWKLDQREAKAKADEEKRAAESALQAQQDNWTAREKAALNAHPDYRELVESTEIPVGPGVLAMRQALLEEDAGAEILYHLASHPAELKRVAGLSPAKAILEIGKLAAHFTGNPENPKPKVSSAPRPPSPLPSGTGRVTESIHDDETARDFKRWTRLREAQLKG